MKKTFLFIGISVILLVLAACGTTSLELDNQVVEGQEPEQQIAIDNQTRDRDQEGNMPLALKLLMGTFKLEETDHPITASQAEEMLPLWKALRSLSESETTASEELDALVNQIEDILTPEQVTEIDAMELTVQDMRVVSEEMGIELGGSGRFGDMTPEMQATREAARESGQFPGGGLGGGIPGQGGGPGGGNFGGISPEARQTAIAEGGGVRGASLGLNPAFLEAMILFLEGKAG